VAKEVLHTEKGGGPIDVCLGESVTGQRSNQLNYVPSCQIIWVVRISVFQDEPRLEEPRIVAQPHWLTRYTCAPATNLLKQEAKGRIK
jgi:hypothetical protein